MSEKREITTRGVVVGRRASGEGSVRVFLYTEALGLVSAVAKSAREERSQLRPHLMWGTTGLFTLVRGRETWRVTGATNAVNIFFQVSHNQSAQSSAARALEMVQFLVRGEGPDPRVFEALFCFLQALPELSDAGTKGAEVLAVLRMLSALGYVEPDSSVDAFLTLSYEPAVLVEAEKMRPQLVHVINEGIAASGL